MSRYATIWGAMDAQDAAHEARMNYRDELEAQMPDGWVLRLGGYPEPEFSATHKDYDASYEGLEDGWVGDPRYAHAPTFEDLLAEIACIEEELAS